MSLRIGVDFGGVCSVHADQYESDVDSEELINVPGCVEALRSLRANGHSLHLVSYCGARRAAATRAYLEPLALFDSLTFVRSRDFKKHACAALGLDVLIDDRLDILATIAPTQPLHFTYEAKFDASLYGKLFTNKGITIFAADSWPRTLEVVRELKKLSLEPQEGVLLDNMCYLPGHVVGQGSSLLVKQARVPSKNGVHPNIRNILSVADREAHLARAAEIQAKLADPAYMAELRAAKAARKAQKANSKATVAQQ